MEEAAKLIGFVAVMKMHQIVKQTAAFGQRQDPAKAAGLLPVTQLVVR